MPRLHFDEIDSTNAYCKSHADLLEDLSFVSASYQSAGRGRNERNWKANKGENLLFSVLLKNGPMLACGPFFSLVSSVAVSKVLERYGLKPSIKWPNDVYVSGKKIAGILLEGVGSSCLIIGIGINVNQNDFQGEYRVSPTSLSLELRRSVDLSSFREEMFSSLEEELRRCNEKESFLSYYKEHDYLLGKQVRYRGEEWVVQGVDDNFALLLGNGKKTISVISGEISLL